MAKKKNTADELNEKLYNLQAQQLAAQVANWAATLDFQKERFRLLELPQFQQGLQFEVDKFAWQKAQDTWERAFQEATLTGTYNGQPTTQWLMDQARLTGSFNGERTLEGRLTDAQIQDMKDKMKLANDEFLANATGYINGQKTFDRQKFEAAQGLEGWKFISTLSGPQNAFKQARAIANAPGGLADIMGAFAGQYMLGGGGSVGAGGAGYGPGQLQDLVLGFGGMNYQTYPGAGSPEAPYYNPNAGAPGPGQPGGPPAGGTIPPPGTGPPSEVPPPASPWTPPPPGQGIGLPPTPPPVDPNAPVPQPNYQTVWRPPHDYESQELYGWMMENPGRSPDEGIDWLSFVATPDELQALWQRTWDKYPYMHNNPRFSPAVRQEVPVGTPPVPSTPYVPIPPNYGAVPQPVATTQPLAAQAAPTTGYTYSPPGVQAPAQAYNYSANASGSTSVYPPGVASPMETADVSSQTPMNPLLANSLMNTSTYQYQAPTAQTTPSAGGGGMIAPNRINAENYANLYDYQKELGWAAYEDAGYDKGLAMEAFQRSLPKYSGPVKGAIAF